MTRVWISLGAGAFAVLLLLGAAAAGVTSAVFGGGGSGCVPDPPPTPPAGLTVEQAANATVIVTVGASMAVPVRGWVIAIATVLQESDLVNLGNLGTANDHDSLGLFQQRPSQGWGTPAQILDPAYASRAFYEHLLRVPDWQSLSVTDAAQAVQRSAYPQAYAAHETRATAIVTAYLASTGSCTGVSLAGWVAPVAGTLTSGFRTADRPTHDGVDLAAPKGTPIRAASSGAVVSVSCNVDGATVPPGSAGSVACDQDGSASTLGCGWYLEIRHVSNVTTRYCHQLRAPLVRVGQPVAVGQIVGVVGTSGNSSGPHLHIEVHLDYPAASDNAVDPVVWFARQGVRL